jgi:opacity protein-like surface antigen
MNITIIKVTLFFIFFSVYSHACAEYKNSFTYKKGFFSLQDKTQSLRSSFSAGSTTNTFVFEESFENIFSLEYERNITRSFSLAVGVLQGNINILSGPSSTSDGAVSKSMDITYYMFMARKYFRLSESSTPYLGIGSVWTDYSIGNYNSGTDPVALQAMVGFKIKFNKVSLVLEYKNISFGEARGPFASNLSVSGSGYFAGVSYNF